MQSAQLVFKRRELGVDLLQAHFCGVVILFRQRRGLDLKLKLFVLQIVNNVRLRIELNAHVCARLIDQVDSFGGQIAARNVPRRQLCSGHQSCIPDAHPVMKLVLFSETTQNADSVIDGWLWNKDLLKATLKSGICLYMLSVFLQSSCPNASQLASREHGLEQICRVDCAFSFSGAHHRVQLIDEQYDALLRLSSRNFFQHGFQALLKLTAILGSSKKRPHVKRKDACLETARHVTPRHALGETFDDGGFAGTWLTYENWVVLPAPRKHANDATNFLISANHRVEFAGFRKRSQIRRVL
mmetsp:Transcript_9673/g.25816  ORF Transcript_9673/g.25816 Transcript_9673/m.25816 type:complete len:299 (-) Transcript_9673:290-1186(-)